MTASFGNHLNLDAIVAFADGEMPMVSFQRAAAHVARCPQCENEVNQQIAARSWLRSAEAPAMPLSLLDSLRSIPVAMPAEPPVDGTASHPATGRASRSDIHDRSAHQRNWRFRFLGAGALVAGLAVGALVIGVDQDKEPTSPNGQLVSGVTSPFVVPVKLNTP
jgi:anti-sigma factor RsiW